MQDAVIIKLLYYKAVSFLLDGYLIESIYL